MTIFQAIALGIVQGITEFAPISSSGHLVLVPWLLGWPEPGLAFSVALHLGTLLAVLAYFRRDLVTLAIAWLGSLFRLGRYPLDGQAKMAWLILLGTIPGAVAGALGDKYIEQIFHQTVEPARLQGVLLIAFALVVLGVVLLIAEIVSLRVKGMGDLSLRDALLIGLAQALALIPGVSRSGATITMGLFRGLERAAAARFSFLLGAPIIAGAGAKEMYDLAKAGLTTDERLVFLAGFLTAALFGYVTIAALLRFLQWNSTLPFVLYRFAVGGAFIALIFDRLAKL